MSDKLNLRPSERRLLVAVAVVLVLVVNVWFVWPHFGDLKRAQTERTKALADLERFNEEIAKVPQRQAEVERLSSVGGKVAKLDQANLMSRTIELAAERHGVTIQRQNQGKSTTGDFFEEQPQTITTLSDEDELVNFLYDLGSDDPNDPDDFTVRVRSLNIQPSPPGRHELRSTITLISSYRLDKPAGKKKRASR